MQPHFYFDYVDPASFVMERRIRRILARLDLPLQLEPWELRPPGQPAVQADDPLWVSWWDEIAPHAREFGAELKAPPRVPFTRKAHELRLHAEEKGEAARVHEALYQAALVRGADIARVDVLVGLATDCGLDLTETRAVLDVDRFSEAVEQVRDRGAAAGVQGVPTLVIGESRMEGVHGDATIREFVTGSMDTEG